MRRWQRGESLLELLVALILLEVAGTAALATALTVERVNRGSTSGAATDRSRWELYRAMESASSCHDTLAARLLPLFLPPTANRPAFPVMVRCGR